MERGKDEVSVRKWRGEEKRKRERGKGKETRWKGEIRRGKEEKKRKGDSVWCCCIGPRAGRWGWSLSPRLPHPGHRLQPVFRCYIRLLLCHPDGSYHNPLTPFIVGTCFFYTVPIISMTWPSNKKLEKKKNLICVIQNFETFFDQILTKITI